MKSTIYCLLFIICTAYSSANAMGPSYTDCEKELQRRIEEKQHEVNFEWQLQVTTNDSFEHILDLFNRNYKEQNLMFHQELCKHGHLLLVQKLLQHLEYQDMRPIYESGLQTSLEHEQHACAEFFMKKNQTLSN